MSNQMQSPLVQIDLSSIAADSAILTVREEAFLGHINLRGATDNTEFMSAAQSVLGVALPIEFNTFVTIGDVTVLWYGPNEWLIITRSGDQAAMIAKLREALAGVFCAVTDISGGNTVLDISGEKSRELLLKGCPLDLHPTVFGVGRCAQTVLAKAGMCVYQYDDAPKYKIVIRRSFSDYIGAWIIDAAREFAN